MERFNFSRWKLLMQQWGLAEHGPLFEMLQDAYRKEGRYYHTEFHVDACLEQLDRFRAELQNPDEVELALWFHDAVYDPFRQDNELKSAQWAQVFLQSQKVESTKSERVYQLIMATCHDNASDLGGISAYNADVGTDKTEVGTDKAYGVAENPDTCWMLDIDLAILGTSSEAYVRYEQAIRSEYLEVPLAVYCRKRAALLQGFLDENALYRTDVFRKEREQQARDNLTWALASLAGGKIPA